MITPVLNPLSPWQVDGHDKNRNVLSFVTRPSTNPIADAWLHPSRKKLKLGSLLQILGCEIDRLFASEEGMWYGKHKSEVIPMSSFFRELFGGHHGKHHGGHHGSHHGGHHDDHHHHDRQYDYRQYGQDQMPPQPTIPNKSLIACPNCSQTNEAHFKFCSQCGTNLQPRPATCQGCGRSVPLNSAFCPNCGNKLGF